MVSFGTGEFMHESISVGKIEVIAVRGIKAAGPRLLLQIKHELRPSPVQFFEPPWKGPVGNYEVLDLSGELRLGNNGPSLGLLAWVERRGYCRSFEPRGDGQVQLVCDLDWPRVERLEEYRNGREILFTVELWPLVLAKGHMLGVHVPPFSVRIERDSWVQVLAGLGYGPVDILEVPRDTMTQTTVQRAAVLLREAHEHIGRGYFDGAAALCRQALEAASHALAIPARTKEGQDPWKTFLTSLREPHIAEKYAGIASRLKQLAGFAHHEPNDVAPPNYSRQEALFLVRSTEALVGLLSDLVVHRAVSQTLSVSE